MLNAALFLDRDGVLIEDTGFPHLPEHLILCTGALEGLRLAQSLGFVLVIVTNQSGLARGFFSIQQYRAFETLLQETLQSKGVHIEKTYFCPHYKAGVVPAWSVQCGCRKPLPGMLFQAASELKIDLTSSYLVGDRKSDLAAAKAAGLKGYFLINKDLRSTGVKENLPEIFLNDKFKGFFANLVQVGKALATIYSLGPRSKL